MALWTREVQESQSPRKQQPLLAGSYGWVGPEGPKGSRARRGASTEGAGRAGPGQARMARERPLQSGAGRKRVSGAVSVFTGARAWTP